MKNTSMCFCFFGKKYIRFGSCGKYMLHSSYVVLTKRENLVSFLFFLFLKKEINLSRMKSLCSYVCLEYFWFSYAFSFFKFCSTGIRTFRFLIWTELFFCSSLSEKSLLTDNQCDNRGQGKQNVVLYNMADLKGTAGPYVIIVNKSCCLKLMSAIMYGICFLQFFTKSAWIAAVWINPSGKKAASELMEVIFANTM